MSAIPTTLRAHPPRRPPRVLIVAEHASAAFGGEAILPLHYFRRLYARGVPVWMIVHERTRRELEVVCADAIHRIEWVPDLPSHRALWKLGEPLPNRLRQATTGWASRTLSQLHALDIARRLVREHGIDVVHQPIPVSPKEPSLLTDVGAPLVVGPMNGGMDYPPAFRRAESRFVRAVVSAGRGASHGINRALPGKIDAATLLVANARTRHALPVGTRGRIVELVENGVDLSLWSPLPASERPKNGPLRAVFSGRLVDWKSVDVLLDAIARIGRSTDVVCDVLGDGPERASLEARATSLGIRDRIVFHGWMSQGKAAEHVRRSDVLVLPSVYECGGAVVLEAMASGIPVVATNWGGPADYVDESSGVLVEPSSREALVVGFADALRTLASDRELCARMGAAGRARVERHFDWDAKIDAILDIYDETIARAKGSERDGASVLTLDDAPYLGVDLDRPNDAFERAE